MFELKKLSKNAGRDIYELLQLIPKDENGLINKANGAILEKETEDRVYYWIDTEK